MSRRVQPRRRRIAWSAWLLPGALVVLSLIGLGLLASSMGWLSEGQAAPRTAPAGTIAVPVAAIDIPAYTRVRLDHLIDPRTGDLQAVYLPEGSILEETLVDPRELIGRVLAADKRPGQVFSETDFFPPGTREGIVAGIPAGKRALRIDATKVNGIVGLARGDRFDLVATDNFRKGRSGPMVVQGVAQGQLGAMGTSVHSSMVVENGAVVQPLETRTIPGRTAQFVEEMVIAVAPEEVELLTRALHSGARVDCVPRSGRPVDEDEAGASSARPAGRRGGVNMVETISGGSRSAVAVPSSPMIVPVESMDDQPEPLARDPEDGGGR
jgi:Flp pilus assembly protein CpaB